MEQKDIYDIIILGGGPAGLTAGIYASRAKASVLILDEGMPGGQLILTHEIANYPGVGEMSGYQLATTMKQQAEKFGCTIKSNVKISSIHLTDQIKQITVNEKETFKSKAVILAVGGKSRMLNVPGENELKGKGISYCATCDGDFFQDKEIIVVGGGNSALEEADSLTKYASKVTIVHQFDHFQAFEHAIQTAKNNPKIDFVMESTIAEFYGEQKLEKVSIKNLKTGEITKRSIDGTFIFIGYVPNTQNIQGLVEMNKYGEIITNNKLQTNIPGVYAAGDCLEKTYRQVTTAVSDGTIAALAAMEYITEN